MAYVHSKLMGSPIPVVSGAMDLLTNRPVMLAAKTRALPLQQEQTLQVPKTISISRRDAMLYVAAEVFSGLTFLSAEPAEARIGKLERKRKIMEKLEKLREEAGISKPRIENGITTPRLPPQRPVRPPAEATLP